MMDPIIRVMQRLLECLPGNKSYKCVCLSFMDEINLRSLNKIFTNLNLLEITKFFENDPNPGHAEVLHSLL